MTVGGNLDLYWLPENHKENRIFEIDKNDKVNLIDFDTFIPTFKKTLDELE